MTKVRWIRTFHHVPYDNMANLPSVGDFAGVVNFDRIDALYPSRTDHDYLNIRMRGDRSERTSWLTVLRRDVHLIEPALTATFPLNKGAGK